MTSAAPAPAATPAFLIDKIRRRVGTPDHSKAMAIRNCIVEHEATRGSRWLWDTASKTAHLLTANGELIQIDKRNSNWTSYLLRYYSVDGYEKLSAHVTSVLSDWLQREGERVNLTDELHEITAWVDNTLHVNTGFNVYQLDGEDEVTFGGQSTEVLFRPTKAIAGPDLELAPHPELFEHTVNQIEFIESTDSGMTAAQQRLAFTCWMFAIAFRSYIRTKPLLIVEGTPGGGKTSAVQLLKYALFGDDTILVMSRHLEKDLGLLMTSPVFIIDNVDNFQGWLQDTICAYATGASWMRRKLFTDEDVIVTKPSAFIAVTSKNPSTFRRDDIADRALILRLGRRSSFRTLASLLSDIDASRDKIIGAWLYYLNQIVKAIRDGVMNRSTTHRLGDFAVFCYAVGYAVGYSNEEIDAMLDAMALERAHFVSEGDILSDLLDLWLDDVHNVGRPVSALQLHSELVETAITHGRKFSMTPHMIGLRLSRDLGSLAVHFAVEMTIDERRRRTYALQKKIR